jgi:N6-L-threonylcarbamoyladenine synthase
VIATGRLHLIADHWGIHWAIEWVHFYERTATAQVAVVGGVAANRRLRRELTEAGARDGFTAVFPPMSLCTDNAAMIAAAGARLLAAGEHHGFALNSFSRVPLGGSPWRSDAAAPRERRGTD